MWWSGSPLQPEETQYVGLPPLLPRQQEAYREIVLTPADGYLLLGYGGGMGGSKSFFIARAAYELAQAMPGISILIARNELTALRETTMREFFMQVHPQMIRERNQNENFVMIGNPELPKKLWSRIKFGGTADYEKLGSAMYQAIFLDECSEISLEAAEYLLTRLRRGHFPAETQRLLEQQCAHIEFDVPGPGDTYMCPNICPEGICPKHGKIKGNGVKYFLVCTANPWPGFFTDWFWKGQIKKIELALPGAVRTKFVQALSRDNPFNGPNYEAMLRATLSPDMVKRMVDGRFDVFAGLVYEGFSAESYPMGHRWYGPVPEYKGVYGGLDYGFEQSDAHYTAGLVAVMSKTNRLIRVDEFKERGIGVYKRHQLWMAEMQKKWGRIRWVGDRSQGLGIGKLKESFDVVMSAGGRDSVESGIRQVAVRFNKDDAGIPGSFYLPGGHDQGGCPEWEKEIQEYVRDKETNKPADKGDDLMACDRYMHEQVGKAWGDPGRFTKNVGRVA